METNDKIKAKKDQIDKLKQIRNVKLGNRIWKLNIGGDLKQVTHATLTMVPHSDLAKMFEDPDKVPTDETGSVFIDHDANAFMLVLNYLRNDCKASQALNDQQKALLAEELDFWKASPLCHPTFVKLEEIMKSVPQTGHEKPLNNWKQEGPLPIRRHVMQGRMKFDPKLEYKEFERKNIKYFGQVDSEGRRCGIGRLVFTDDGETQEGEWKNDD